MTWSGLRSSTSSLASPKLGPRHAVFTLTGPFVLEITPPEVITIVSQGPVRHYPSGEALGCQAAGRGCRRKRSTAGAQG